MVLELSEVSRKDVRQKGLMGDLKFIFVGKSSGTL